MLIQCLNLKKTYRLDGVFVPVLKNVNAAVKKGEFTAVMGPSGSGKSTLMHLIGLLDVPTNGQVLLEGKDVSEISEEERAKLRNEKIGFVFQTFNLLPRTSALDNVKLPLIYKHPPVSNADLKVMEVLTKLGLEKRAHHQPNQLSGGEQQRVAIARALVNNPSIILADEPTGNLDSKTSREIMEIFRKLHQEGHTIVMVTHDPAIAKYAERIIYIRDGTIAGKKI